MIPDRDLERLCAAAFKTLSCERLNSGPEKTQVLAVWPKRCAIRGGGVDHMRHGVRRHNGLSRRANVGDEDAATRLRSPPALGNVSSSRWWFNSGVTVEYVEAGEEGGRVVQIQSRRPSEIFGGKR